MVTYVRYSGSQQGQGAHRLGIKMAKLVITTYTISPSLLLRKTIMLRWGSQSIANTYFKLQTIVCALSL